MGDVDGYGVSAGFVARPVGAGFGGFAAIRHECPVVGEALQTLALARREAADSETVGDSVDAHGIERVGHSLLRAHAVAAVVVLATDNVFGDADGVGIEHKRQVCAKPKKELKRSATGSGVSISKFEGLTGTVTNNAYYSRTISISTIEFFPNLDGKINGVSIREIFLNPENTIVVSRKNSNEIERDYSNGSRIWRAPIITYYRK